MKKINLAIAQILLNLFKRYKNMLNLDCLDYVKIGRYISNSFHSISSLKITSIIDKHPRKSLQHRQGDSYLIEALKCIKKFLVNEIVLSGWNNYNDLSIKNNILTNI